MSASSRVCILNNTVNRSTGYTPFAAAYSHNSKHVMDLFSVPSQNNKVEILVWHNRKIYEEVHAALGKSNDKYKDPC